MLMIRCSALKARNADASRYITQAGVVAAHMRAVCAHISSEGKRRCISILSMIIAIENLGAHLLMPCRNARAWRYGAVQ